MDHNVTLNKIKELLSDAPSSLLKEVIKLSTNQLLSKEHNSPPCPSEEDLEKLFTYVPNALNKFSLEISTSPDTIDNEEHIPDESAFFQELRDELLSLGLHNRKSNKFKKNKPASQWVLTKPHNHPDLKNGLALNKFKCLSKLCKITNEHDETKGIMTGANINCYRGKNSRTRPHADDEKYINQESSVCTWSLDSEREFRIFRKKHWNEKHDDDDYLKSFTLQHGSLMFMHPGSQACTKHKVMPGDTNGRNLDDEDDISDLRFSISWRDIIYDDHECDTSTVSETNSSKNTQPKDTSLIFGTSISKYLDEKKLQGRRNIRVLNCSQSGAKLSDVSDQMDTLFTSEKIENERLNVKNVFICVGTNDVASLRNSTPNHLYVPIVNLLKKAKTLFNGANVYVQSVLPMTVTSRYTVGNVLYFNKLILKACAAEKCFYLDIFNNFLDKYGYNNAQLFRLNSRTNLIDVHLNSRGLGVLAKSYIDYIRGRFNPIKY